MTQALSQSTARETARVGIGGLGAVGRALASALSDDESSLHIGAVSARDGTRAAAWLEKNGIDAPVVPIHKLSEYADIIVECAPSAVFEQIAVPAVEAGKLFIPISVGALLGHMWLIDRARECGARIVVPTGALLGLDAVRAAREGRIETVTMVTRKPPGGLAGAPYLAAHNINLDSITEPTLIFSGNAREGAIGFPANVNVAAALALAGIGPEKTQLQIWADPGVSRNIHTITVESDSARFNMTIENVPSVENPRTGRIVAKSVIATLRREVATLTVGT